MPRMGDWWFMSMQWKAADLDEFVRRSDELGGPSSAGCNAFWHGFEYLPGCAIDCGLDPFSEAYVSQQIRLYEELSGRYYDTQRDEMTSLDVPRHVTAPNPYNHPDPAVLAVHLQRLSRAMRYAAPVRGETLLDMGCGWGLSSEVAAYLGLHVRAVDINPDFVRLVRERAERGQRSITVVQSTFETYAPPEPADMALFYECLHHAIRPWSVVERIADNLKDEGRIVLAGEPINDYWWPNWGMRLDAMSVYCIRKFGWFESGWSLRFILQVLHRAGFVPRVHASDDAEIGYVVVGRKAVRHDIPGDIAAMLFSPVNAVADGPWLLLTGAGSLTILFPRGAREAILNLTCFRGGSVKARFDCNGTVFDGDMPGGRNQLTLERADDVSKLTFDIEPWSPAEELQSSDSRTLGLHLESIAFIKD